MNQARTSIPPVTFTQETLKAAVGRRDAVERAADGVAHLASKRSGGVSVSRDELAAYLNVSPSHASVLLKRASERGLVKQGRNRLAGWFPV